jgi:hypothetical protein
VDYEKSVVPVQCWIRVGSPIPLDQNCLLRNISQPMGSRTERMEFRKGQTDEDRHDLLVMLADKKAAPALIDSLKRSTETLNAEKSLLLRQRDDARGIVGSLQAHIHDLQKGIDELINDRDTLELQSDALKKARELAIQKDLFTDLEHISSTNIAEMRRERAEKQQLPEVEQKAMKAHVAKAITEADSAWLRKIKVMEIEHNQRIASMERMVAMSRAEESKTIMRAKKRSDSDEL